MSIIHLLLSEPYHYRHGHQFGGGEVGLVVEALGEPVTEKAGGNANNHACEDVGGVVYAEVEAREGNAAGPQHRRCDDVPFGITQTQRGGYGKGQRGVAGRK